MKTIDEQTIITSVKAACIDINTYIDTDLEKILQNAKNEETKPLAKLTLDTILENAQIASDEQKILCQDTGMIVVFAEVGNELKITGDLYEAINEGVRQGYQDGYLRKSIVDDPILRNNTKDNTPAIIHTKLVAGNKLKLKIAAKGGGAENMSATTMLKPSDGIVGIKKFVLETIANASGNPCPPLVVGIGIGGNFEKCSLLAKEALFRKLDDVSPLPHISELETTLLKEINALDVGPMGFGGKTTALAVKINTFPTHIASLPVALNLNCHSSRKVEVVL